MFSADDRREVMYIVGCRWIQRDVCGCIVGSYTAVWPICLANMSSDVESLPPSDSDVVEDVAEVGAIVAARPRDSRRPRGRPPRSDSRRSAVAFPCIIQFARFAFACGLVRSMVLQAHELPEEARDFLARRRRRRETDRFVMYELEATAAFPDPIRAGPISAIFTALEAFRCSAAIRRFMDKYDMAQFTMCDVDGTPEDFVDMHKTVLDVVPLDAKGLFIFPPPSRRQVRAAAPTGPRRRKCDGDLEERAKSVRQRILSTRASIFLKDQAKFKHAAAAMMDLMCDTISDEDDETFLSRLKATSARVLLRQRIRVDAVSCLLNRDQYSAQPKKWLSTPTLRHS